MERGGYAEKLAETLAPGLESIDKVHRRSTLRGGDLEGDELDAQLLGVSVVRHKDATHVAVDKEEEFDCQKITVGIKSSSPLVGFSCRYFNLYAEGMLQEKMDKHDEQMRKPENERWAGCQRAAAVSVQPEFSWAPFGGPPFMSDVPEGSGIATVLKNGCNRISMPGSVFPGCGQVVRGLTSGICVIAIPITKIIKGGVLLNDMESYLSGPHGPKAISDQAVIINLFPGRVAFIPWGFYAWPVHMDMRKDAEVCPWGHMWTLPLFEEKLCAHLDAAVLQAILTYNKNWLKAQSASFYQVRGALVEAFEKAVLAK